MDVVTSKKTIFGKITVGTVFGGPNEVSVTISSFDTEADVSAFDSILLKIDG